MATDIGGVVNEIGVHIGDVAQLVPDIVQYNQLTATILLSVAVIASIACIVLFIFLHKIKRQVMGQTPGPGQTKPRFRKRDKVIFYGRRMLRKVKSISGPITSTRTKLMKRKRLIGDLKRLLSRTKESGPVLQEKEPPPAVLEADWREIQQSELTIPPEVIYMLKSVRVFGHFEKPLFLELCRHMETKFIMAGSYLFRKGQPDDSIYVVQSGKLSVYISEKDGSESVMKEVCAGDSVHSLLSVLDVITGHPAPYKTVSARAVVDTTILKLPAQAFCTVFENYPESLVRVVQIIVVRLQRVTFMALHNYLGLSNELINPENQSNKDFSVHNISPKTSPTKRSLNQELSVESMENETVTEIIDFDQDYLPEISPSKSQHDAVISDSPLKGSMTYMAELLDTQQRRSRSSSLPAGARRPPLEHSGRASSLDRDSATSLGTSPSDFDAVVGQARVQGFDDKVLFVASSPSNEELDEIQPEVTSSKSRPDTLFSSEKINKKEKKVVFPKQEEKLTPDDDEILQMAINDLTVLLGLEDDSLLKSKVSLVRVSAGKYLTREGDQDCSLYFVVTGCLGMHQKRVGIKGEENTVFIAHPGELVGTIAVLTGEPSFFTIRARKDSRVVVVSKTNFYSIMRASPRVVLNVAHSIVRRLSPFVRQIDFALDWMHLEAGRAVFRQDDESDCTYIILNGRLRSVATLENGKKELVGEYGRGDLVGIVEVLTQSKRVTTVHAVRDTELAKVPEGLLNTIKRKYPQVVTRLIHLLGQRILGTITGKSLGGFRLTDPLRFSERPSASTLSNLSTVAVLPVSSDVPLSSFTVELEHALCSIGTTLRLTSEHIRDRLGSAALDSINEFRLASWLAQQEDIHRITLYQADFRMTPWTLRCIRQADSILIVGLADKDPNIVGDSEKQLETLAVRAQKELVLLHKEVNGSYKEPRRTVEWLNTRGWVSSHHHIRCPKRIFSKRSAQKRQDMYKKLFERPPDRHSDFSRLARFLTGTSIGLVLGGGGARGSSEVGIMKAMEENSIPIDIIGGTSIGSFVGALYADEVNADAVSRRAKEWCKEMGTYWSKILDLTYPVTAMFTGGSFNRSIEDVFRNKQIEDLWLPFFVISTDISSSSMRVHTSGSLWRYVRASMSLSGYLPPLCDPKDGHLLLDGGYVNNLPADVMKSMGAQTIIAVDVGSQDVTHLTNYGDTLSGWWLLWKRWNPWASAVRVPDMTEIQSRLAYVSCVRHLEELKNSRMCEYIRPPIDRFKTLEFNRFDEIKEVGYQHGMTVFSGWQKGKSCGICSKKRRKREQLQDEDYQLYLNLRGVKDWRNTRTSDESDDTETTVWTPKRAASDIYYY
ncbi:patatin-like phospholipase domain-containing protein 7 [Saccoglossus kowalevskii]|uniref:Patatin-like phospholipase domain-containing protein 7-like n=1 Tax=Saccoglossus kowalevskii TaxID=10224 RepID=A0ABM0MFI6_SACKO|nr:PREDICTED: patatin-like phospholipase domain-containing protein 7-like [Saccoglossus kowalevskii]